MEEREVEEGEDRGLSIGDVLVEDGVVSEVCSLRSAAWGGSAVEDSLTCR